MVHHPAERERGRDCGPYPAAGVQCHRAGKECSFVPEPPAKPRVWLCDTWEERDALVKRLGRERLRITVVEEIDEFDIMQTKYRVEELPASDPQAPRAEG